MTPFPMLVDEATTPVGVLMLAHGSGAPMDSDVMSAFAELMTARGLSVVRFEFEYMAARRSGGAKRPPPRVDTLTTEYLSAIAAAKAHRVPGTPFLIGGKSLGGRVASMVADVARADGLIDGLVCLGYPFHPPKKPETLRTAHLVDLTCPTLICQGTRDPLGTRDEVLHYDLSSAITVNWLEDGDHDLKPRKRSGHTHDEHLCAAADRIVSFVRGLTPRR